MHLLACHWSFLLLQWEFSERLVKTPESQLQFITRRGYQGAELDKLQHDKFSDNSDAAGIKTTLGIQDCFVSNVLCYCSPLTLTWEVINKTLDSGKSCINKYSPSKAISSYKYILYMICDRGCCNTRYTNYLNRGVISALHSSY